MARSQPVARGEESRQRILAAATHLFAHLGYEGVTMRAIGEAAGLDNSSIYRHFASKAQLAEQIHESVMEEVAARVTALPRSGSPELEDLVRVAVELSDYFSERPDAARIVLNVLATPPDSRSGFNIAVSASDASRPSVRVLAGLFEWLGRASRSGTVRPLGDVLEAGVALIGAVLLRPATGTSFLTWAGDAFSPAARAARRREVEAFVRAAFAKEGPG